jgi:hypothetical protein
MAATIATSMSREMLTFRITNFSFSRYILEDPYGRSTATDSHTRICDMLIEQRKPSFGAMRAVMGWSITRSQNNNKQNHKSIRWT